MDTWSLLVVLFHFPPLDPLLGSTKFIFSVVTDSSCYLRLEKIDLGMLLRQEQTQFLFNFFFVVVDKGILVFFICLVFLGITNLGRVSKEIDDYLLLY